MFLNKSSLNFQGLFRYVSSWLWRVQQSCGDDGGHRRGLCVVVVHVLECLFVQARWASIWAATISCCCVILSWERTAIVIMEKQFVTKLVEYFYRYDFFASLKNHLRHYFFNAKKWIISLSGFSHYFFVFLWRTQQGDWISYITVVVI